VSAFLRRSNNTARYGDVLLYVVVVVVVVVARPTDTSCGRSALAVIGHSCATKEQLGLIIDKRDVDSCTA